MAINHSFRVSLDDHDLASLVRRWGNKVEDGTVTLTDLSKHELTALEYALETLGQQVDHVLTERFGVRKDRDPRDSLSGPVWGPGGSLERQRERDRQEG